MNAIEIFCDANSGIYIPQRFAREVNRELVSGVSDDDYSILEAGPDNELYWDTWDAVERDAVIRYGDRDYRLHLDGDLFIICDDAMSDDVYEQFYGEERA